MHYTFLERCYFTLKYRLKRLNEGLFGGDTASQEIMKWASKTSFTDVFNNGFNIGDFFKLIWGNLLIVLDFLHIGPNSAAWKWCSKWWGEASSATWGSQGVLGQSAMVIICLAGLSLIFWLAIKFFKWIRNKFRRNPVSAQPSAYSEGIMSKVSEILASNVNKNANEANRLALSMPSSDSNTNKVKEMVSGGTKAMNIIQKNGIPNNTKVNASRTAESVARYIWKNTSLNVNECAKIYNYLRG